MGNRDKATNHKWGYRFHFEQAWAENEECQRIIKAFWDCKVLNNPLHSLSHRITSCGKKLSVWNIQQKKDLNTRTKELKAKLEVLSKSVGVTINSLLNEDGSWKLNEVISWFHLDDVPWIIGTMPSMQNSDSVTWTLTPNGNYTVASGYKLRFSNPEIAGCSDISKIKAWWSFIWGFRLTPKMKNFIWRVYNHWIPIKVELCKRRMNIDTSCDWCKTHDETLCHALWLCPARRNQFVFQHKKPDDSYWIPWALETLDIHLWHGQQQRKVQQSPTKSSWQPPPIGKFLINSDASLVPNHSGCGISAIIRDHNGELIAAETRFIHGFISVVLAETVAIRMGLDLVLRWSCSYVLIGADCQTVVNAIKNKEAIHTDWGNIIQNEY
ncbi:hypothetical protein F8388_011737 [Cannabis sativa]|uniref:RNase H type-1 domain-containing protein n=1 Tax=Cannabis sativa TaxID=3483 RepID=A0A7J6FGW8_CANSA|nr:hypothetical protein F8388_011737 [Cannabis sativa]